MLTKHKYSFYSFLSAIFVHVDLDLNPRAPVHFHQLNLSDSPRQLNYNMAARPVCICVRLYFTIQWASICIGTHVCMVHVISLSTHLSPALFIVYIYIALSV